jgi:hypothetical protein
MLPGIFHLEGKVVMLNNMHPNSHHLDPVDERLLLVSIT